MQKFMSTEELHTEARQDKASSILASSKFPAAFPEFQSNPQIFKSDNIFWILRKSCQSRWPTTNSTSQKF